MDLKEPQLSKEMSQFLNDIGMPGSQTRSSKKLVLPEITPKSYNLPRRYDVREMTKLKTSSRQALIKNEARILQLDSKIAQLDDQTAFRLKKEIKNVYITQKTPQRKPVFRKKAIKDHNMTLFKEIFVQPKEKKLSKLKEFTDIKDDEAKKLDKVLKMYEEKDLKKFKIFEVEKPDEALEKMREVTRKPDNYEIFNKSQLKKRNQKKVKMVDSDLRNHMTRSAIHNRSYHKKVLQNVSTSMIINESVEDGTKIVQEGAFDLLSTNKKIIFNQQIQVEPPDFPNAHSGSPIAPGLGWAPSIPFIIEDESRLSLGDLLTRARAGMQSGEVQQEAHLSFYLALTYENKKMYKKVDLH